MIGVFHENTGPLKRWPRKTEGARRGLIDTLETMITEEGEGIVGFWRWKAWILVASFRGGMEVVWSQYLMA